MQSLLPATWQVPAEFRERLGTQAGRQRAMEAEGHLLLVMHEPPKPGEDERRGRFFWRSPSGAWSSSGLGTGAAAINKHLAEYADVVDKYDRLEEQAQSADQYFAVLEGLAPVQRSAHNMHEVLQEARQLVPEDRDLINQRDRAYQIERTAELLYNLAKNGLDYAVARRAEEQATSSRHMAAAAHRLNVLAAFFFPIVTLTAIFGTNLRSGLEELAPPLPLLGVLGVGLLCGVVLTLVIVSKKR